jgi:hypothetical protein
VKPSSEGFGPPGPFAVRDLSFLGLPPLSGRAVGCEYPDAGVTVQYVCFKQPSTVGTFRAALTCMQPKQGGNRESNTE